MNVCFSYDSKHIFIPGRTRTLQRRWKSKKAWIEKKWWRRLTQTFSWCSTQTLQEDPRKKKRMLRVDGQDSKYFMRYFPFFYARRRDSSLTMLRRTIALRGRRRFSFHSRLRQKRASTFGLMTGSQISTSDLATEWHSLEKILTIKLCTSNIKPLVL